MLRHGVLQTTLAGCILWLPRKDQIDRRLALVSEIDDGCFNHPVAVLSVNPEERTAIVFIVSILYPKIPQLLCTSSANTGSSLH